MSLTKKLIIVLSSIMCVGSCALPTPIPYNGFQSKRPEYVDPEFVPYVEIYKGYKKEYLGHDYLDYTINVNFYDSPNKQIGKCLVNSQTKVRYIKIDIQWWSRANENDREVLIVHEMGHCDLNIVNHHVYGIMRESHLHADEYLRNKGLYLEKMFMDARERFEF